MVHMCQSTSTNTMKVILASGCPSTVHDRLLWQFLNTPRVGLPEFKTADINIWYILN